MQNYMSKTMCAFAKAHNVHMLLVSHKGTVRVRVNECVCLRREPVELSCKGPLQLCRQTGNCHAFSQFHMAPSVSSALGFQALFSRPLKQPKAPCSSRRLPTLCTNVTKTIHLFAFLTANLLLLAFPSCWSLGGPLC